MDRQLRLEENKTWQQKRSFCTFELHREEQGKRELPQILSLGVFTLISCLLESHCGSSHLEMSKDLS